MQIKLDPNTFSNLAKDPKVLYLIEHPEEMKKMMEKNPMLQ